MVKEAIDRQSLSALIKETLSKFPPLKNSDNARSFRLISVDYLEGKISHPQFNLLYAAGRTAGQITDGIINTLKAGQPRTPANPRLIGDAAPQRWRLQQHKTSRLF
jgi:hypothetical protein